jgi:hypothetical protein
MVTFNKEIIKIESSCRKKPHQLKICFRLKLQRFSKYPPTIPLEELFTLLENTQVSSSSPLIILLYIYNNNIYNFPSLLALSITSTAPSPSHSTGRFSRL